MNHTKCLFAIMAFVVAMASCSKEDVPEVNFKNPSASFQPSADDQSLEAQLRQQFFQETGCYLLFNDTIQRDSLGIDINGEPRYFVETVDMTYVVGQTSSMSTRYSYVYLATDEQKQQVVGFLKQYILPHFSGKLRPYCWLLVDVINSKASETATPTKPYAISNQRCLAVAANYLLQRERTDAQLQQYAQRILYAVIGQLAVNHSEAFSEFFKVSAPYYNADYSAYGIEGKPTNDFLYSVGLLSSTGAVSFPSSTTDLGSYALLVIQYDADQIAQRYASYPLIQQKAALAREALVQLGYVF